MKKNYLITFVLVVVLVLTVLVILAVKRPLVEVQASDNVIIEDFSNIQNKIVAYYKTHNELPGSLDKLSDINTKYDYVTTEKTSFKLCSDFSSDITDDIKLNATIRVDFKKGYDCVVFNISNLVTPDGNSLVKGISVRKITPVKGTFKIDNTGITLDKIFTVKFDTTKSLISSVDNTKDLLVNLYTTVGTKNECNTTVTTPECYYSLSELSLYATDGTKLAGNRLGSEEYISPFQDNAVSIFGDLPLSFYFQNSNSVSGGFSFILPKKFGDKSNKFTLEAKYKNEVVSKIVISL